MKHLDNVLADDILYFEMYNNISHNEKNRGKHGIQSLSRGLEILRSFSTDTPTLKLKDIAHKLNLPAPTVFRYISTLEDLGYLTKDGSTKEYRLTVKVLDLGFSALNSLGFPNIALPYLEELAQKCQESASMAVLEGSDVVYVARAATKRWMSTNLQVGSRLPAFCTSLGRALLAYKPFSEVKSILSERKLTAYTPYTITDIETLKKVLAKVRQDGYAINDQELEIGLRSAAAPIRGARGKVIASINVSMASARVPLEMLKKEFVPHLLTTAREISCALGYRPSSKT